MKKFLKPPILINEKVKKLILIMKLTALILVLSLVQVSATSYSQATKFSFPAENKQVVEVLQQIEESSDFRFFFLREQVDVERKVSVAAHESTVEQILDGMFHGRNVSYEFANETLVVLTRSDNPLGGIHSFLQENMQQPTISGNVTDEAGQPMSGVTVVIKGTTQGTVTGSDGNYTLTKIPEDAILVFSFVGMQAQEVEVGNQTTIDVVLSLESIGMDEVVVVGYGTMKSVNVTGSISSVKSEDLVIVPSTNTTAVLAGRLPGLIVHQTSGQPGADVANVRIRGFGSALVIVDGVERSFTRLDPNVIESVTILKDASAAVYGARAGNGVILVTTKRGNSSTPEITLNSSFSASQNALYPDYVDAFKFATMYSRAEGGLGEGFRFSQEDLDKYAAGTEPGFIGTKWDDRVMKDWAPQLQHNVNVRGGTENVKYFLSAGYLDQRSIWQSNDGEYQRYNINSNVDVNITDNLSAGLSLSYRREHRDNPISTLGILTALIFADPTVDAANWPFPDLIQDSAPLRSGENSAIPLMTQAHSGFENDKRGEINSAIDLNYNLPLKGLSIDGKLAYTKNDIYNTIFRRKYETYIYDYETETLAGPNVGGLSYISKIGGESQRITTQLALRYDGKFGNHRLGGLLLNEQININSDFFLGRVDDLISNELPYLFAGDATTAVATDAGRVSEDGRASWVGRLNYNYMEKYLVEATFRYDASPRFAPDERRGFFPSVLLGWRISEESFMESSFVNYLKLRASAGKSGNDGTSQYDYLTGFALQPGDNNTYIFGGDDYKMLGDLGLANPFITWENINLYNIGVDASLWNSLIGIEFDVFYRERTGLLANRLATISNTFGANLPQENINSQDNRGFEIVLNHRKTIGAFSYSVSGNLSVTRAKWIHREEREFEEGDDERINKQTGEWVNRTFGYLTDGLFNSQKEIDDAIIDYDQSGNTSLIPGDFKYIDYNLDGVITPDDRVELGRGTIPEMMYGLNASANYKGFDLNMLWQGAGNFVTVFTGDNLAGLRQSATNPMEYHWKYQWNPENTETAKLPAANLVGISVYNSKVSDATVKDATYVRLKNLSIGYTLPNSFLGNSGIQNVRLYVSGTNLITIANLGIFEDYDPEISNRNAQQTYPIQRVFSLGLNITL